MSHCRGCGAFLIRPKEYYAYCPRCGCTNPITEFDVPTSQSEPPDELGARDTQDDEDPDTALHVNALLETISGNDIEESDIDAAGDALRAYSRSPKIILSILDALDWGVWPTLVEPVAGLLSNEDPQVRLSACRTLWDWELAAGYWHIFEASLSENNKDVKACMSHALFDVGIDSGTVDTVVHVYEPEATERGIPFDAWELVTSFGLPIDPDDWVTMTACPMDYRVECMQLWAQRIENEALRQLA